MAAPFPPTAATAAALPLSPLSLLAPESLLVLARLTLGALRSIHDPRRTAVASAPLPLLRLCCCCCCCCCLPRCAPCPCPSWLSRPFFRFADALRKRPGTNAVKGLLLRSCDAWPKLALLPE